MATWGIRIIINYNWVNKAYYKDWVNRAYYTWWMGE